MWLVATARLQLGVEWGVYLTSVGNLRDDWLIGGPAAGHLRCWPGAWYVPPEVSLTISWGRELAKEVVNGAADIRNPA